MVRTESRVLRGRAGAFTTTEQATSFGTALLDLASEYSDAASGS